MQRQLRMLLEELQFFDSTDITFTRTTRGIRANLVPKPSQAGTQGLVLQTPNLELDPTVAVAVRTIVYISPLNALVTAGMVDLTPGSPYYNTTVMATPGWWFTVKPVPAAVGGGYYVPQLPLPTVPAAPSGSPLKGDADAASVFWMPGFMMGPCLS